VRSSLPEPSETGLPTNLPAWLALLERLHPKTIDLGLDRCREVWQRMGRPVPAPRLCVVAGTNGKGSTVATLCSLLAAFGQRCGSYTSPHLYRYNERVLIAGEEASDQALVDSFRQVEAARGSTSLTYFEFGTLAAFQLMADAGLDHAVLEIGLGGRLDAVNLLDADVAVITPIGLDHQEYLGPDRESIGREKAGIVRPGRPLVCGEPEPPASVIATAERLAAPLQRLDVEFRAQAVAEGLLYTDGLRELTLPAPALPGPHQFGNLATSLATLFQLLPAAASEPELLARGIRNVRVPGRLQRLPGNPPLWIDVGHNPLAARAVAAALAEACAREGLSGLRCVLGMLRDKDAAGVAAELGVVVSHWYCASLGGERGQSAAGLAERIRSAIGSAPLQLAETVDEALQRALDDCGAGEGVLAFGSFLTAAEAGLSRRVVTPEADLEAGRQTGHQTGRDRA